MRLPVPPRPFLCALLLPAAGMIATAFLPVPARAQDPMAAIRANRWDEAQRYAGLWADPLARRLVEYYRVTAPNGASTQDIAAFMEANPTWPSQGLLARRRDEALAREPDGPAVIGLCQRYPPSLASALLRCSAAFLSDGKPDDAAGAVRAAWRTGTFDAPGEAAFLKRWGAIVTAQDQRDRFDRLAWSDTEAASRQIPRLDVASRPAAEIRLALRRDDPAAPARLATLSIAARTQPAMMLEFARWLRRANQTPAALALWTAQGEGAQFAAPDGHRADFWTERNVLARRLLRDGNAEGAYALAALPGQDAAGPMTEADFLAGFIALRKLADPERALPHFRALSDAGTSVITRARGHYWTARALAAAGQDPAAEFAAAAAFPLTFYGQLAARAHGEDGSALAARIRAMQDPGWTRDEALDFAGSELVRAAALLAAWGEPSRSEAFLLREEETTTLLADRSLSARLGLGLGLPEIAVAVARRMGRDGLALPDAGWPLPVTPPDTPVPPAATLALIRQESSFDIAAVSPSGARGLMQLMPATAAAIAKTVGEQTSTLTLTTDAAHNMRLGTAYLQTVLDRFGGSLPLAFAAYNAGPNRVAEWIATYGDPRAEGGVEMLEWMEMIPFNETRNYVQRVLENLVIYQAKRGEPLSMPVPPFKS